MRVHSLHPKNEKIPSRLNFRGKSNLNELANEVSKKSQWVPRLLTYLGQHDGEILNTTVTAGGTAIVAPIFIAGNPFSKEDAETKWYTAMRQPISAVIALVMQLWINKEFNNFMDKGGSTGMFGEPYDLRAMPKANYLKRIVKLEHPEWSKEEISAEVSKRQIQAERRRIAEVRSEMNGRNIKTSEMLSKDILEEAKKQLAKEFKEANNGELTVKNQTEYSEFLDKNLSKSKITKRALQNIQESVVLEAKAKFKLRELAKRFSNIDDAVKYLSELTSEGKAEKEIIENVLNRLETIKIYEDSKNMKPFSSVKDLGKTYEEILHNVKVKRMVRAKASNAAKALGKANNWLGIMVSLVTLPFSCGALNWAYPRVMEKIMPTISKWIHRNDPVKVEELAKTEENVNKNIAVQEDIEIDDGGDDDED